MGVRALATFAAWLAATGLAIAVSWYGLRPVLQAAVPERGVPLSAEDLRERSPAPPPSRPPVATIGPTPAPVGGAGPTHRSPPVMLPASPALRFSPSPAAATTTPPPPQVVDGWTVVTESDGGISYVRTFAVEGGETAARVEPGTVTLISATPRPGYAVRAEQPSATRLVVQFWTATSMSTVDVMWWEGRPWSAVTEQ